MSTATKNKVTILYDIGEIPTEDFVLLGIKSNAEDFRLAYLINLQMSLRLERQEDILLNDKKGQGHFGLYHYIDQKFALNWRLISNDSQFHTQTKRVNSFSLFDEVEEPIDSSIKFVPELKRFDYLLHIDNTDEAFEVDDVIENLQKIHIITTIYQADIDQIKNIKHLIF